MAQRGPGEGGTKRLRRVSGAARPAGPIGRLAHLAVALTVGLGGCGESDPTGPPAQVELPRALTSAEAEVVGAANRFAFDLLAEVASDETAANMLLSPFSASTALGMTLNGTAGDTWTQMRDMLGFQGLEQPAINRSYLGLIDLLRDLDPAVELGIANSVWAREGYPFHAAFMDTVRTYFDAEVQELDFHDPAALGIINGWVDDATHGRIDKILDAIPPSAIMYLINAVSFNGDWRTTFDEDLTRPAPFTLADGRPVQDAMMEGAVGYRTVYQDGIQALELPYAGDAFSAIAVLPPPGQSATALAASLTPEQWDGWMETFAAQADHEDLAQPGVVVRLPKLELEYDRLLNADLRRLGMVDAFSAGRADFSRLTPAGGVHISRVLQKTFLKVDEEGTEAAAATAVEVVETAGPGAQVITFDRPFLFAIRERLTGTILFIGVIGDPRG